MSTVDDTLDTFFFTLDGEVCLNTLFNILDLELDEQPTTDAQDTWSITHYHPITSAFSYMAKIAPRCDPQAIDQRLANGGQHVLVKVKDRSIWKRLIESSTELYSFFRDAIILKCLLVRHV